MECQHGGDANLVLISLFYFNSVRQIRLKRSNKCANTSIYTKFSEGYIIFYIYRILQQFATKFVKFTNTNFKIYYIP